MKIRTGSFVLASTVAMMSFATVNPALPTDSLTVFPDSIVPAIGLPDADGNYSLDRLINMKSTEHGYEADSVVITDGAFRFYAPNTSASEDTALWKRDWFTLSVGAVNPPLEYYLNPLYTIITGGPQAIEIPNGTYHFWYFDQTDNGQHYNLFTYAPVGDSGENTPYPPSLYIIDMANQWVEVPQSADTPGLYEGDILLPEDNFKVSFQRDGYWIPGFIFGPAVTGNTALAIGSNVPIEFGTNTWTPFTYATDAETDSIIKGGETVYFTIDLSGVTNYMTIKREKTSIVSNGIGSERRVTARFNMQGIPVTEGKGMTIVKYSDGTSQLEYNR